MTYSGSSEIKPSSAEYRDGGLYVLRSERIYCLSICHKIGVSGNGPHKHNDWLSFEFCLDGMPVIVDPGTYCYTGDIEKRRMFRSTAYHNTLMVDNAEQIPIEKTIFGLKKPVGDASVISWDTDDAHDELVAEHSGYMRLNNPVMHRRYFRLDKEGHVLRISDMVSGEGTHRLEWNFHLEPGLALSIDKDRVSVCMENKRLLDICFDPAGLMAESIDGWISARYNQREQAGILRLSSEGAVNLPFKADFDFVPGNP